jgi:hypothetical protein
MSRAADNDKGQERGRTLKPRVYLGGVVGALVVLLLLGSAVQVDKQD